MASGTDLVAVDRVWLCRSCGVEYGRSASPPERCAICTDEREVWPSNGQAWTTLDELDDGNRRVVVDAVEPRLWGLSVEPTVGLGQRALLVQTDAGNLLWDVPGFINAAAVSEIRDLGGVAAIVASHPHMYGAQLEWSAAFGDAPVWTAAKDADWLGRREPAIRTWDAPFDVLPGIHLLQPGGHFPGSTVAWWTDTADGGNALLSGDTVMACPDQGWVTFMRSFPNAIPLSAAVVRRVADSVRDLHFDRLYDNFAGTVSRDASAAVQRSAERYIAWVSGANDHLT
jgi:glyoxylase-like metal-dependent hydrolase (beta-lactamase superfamily II)